MSADLWNDETANLIDYLEEAEALAYIRIVLLRDGEQAIISWALDRYDGKPMIRGNELVALARGAVAA